MAHGDQNSESLHEIVLFLTIIWAAMTNISEMLPPIRLKVQNI